MFQGHDEAVTAWTPLKGNVASHGHKYRIDVKARMRVTPEAGVPAASAELSETCCMDALLLP